MAEARKAAPAKKATSAPEPVDAGDQVDAPEPVDAGDQVELASSGGVVDAAALQAEINRLRDKDRAREVTDLQAEISRLQSLVPAAPEPVAERTDTVAIDDITPGTFVQLVDNSRAYALVVAPGELIVLGTPQRHECDVVKVG